jgi:hypothetical protein
VARGSAFVDAQAAQDARAAGNPATPNTPAAGLPKASSVNTQFALGKTGKPAPVGAVLQLKQDPSLTPQFYARYGYVPKDFAKYLKP